MNRTKKLLFGLVGALAATMGQAQIVVRGPIFTGTDLWEDICRGATENTAYYSTDYGMETVTTLLFRAIAGQGGTVRMGTACFTSDFNMALAGGLGFAIGSLGSVQDGGFDDAMDLFWGMPNGVGGDSSYAVTVKVSADGKTVTRTRYGASGIDTFYLGASDRYIISESTNDGIRVQQRTDVVGDAARVQWSLTNTDGTTSFKLGLDYGGHFSAKNAQFPASILDLGTGPDRAFVSAPGFKPLSTEHQWFRTGADLASIPPKYPMVDYVNFGYTQANAWGLHVVNSPTDPYANVGDQTPVDEFAVGNTGTLLGPVNSNAGKLIDPLVSIHGSGNLVNADLNFYLGYGGAGCGFVQCWNPVTVSPSTGGASATRTIVAYYRSTNAFADYSAPYSVVLDGPRVISTNLNDAFSFAPNAFSQATYGSEQVIRVYIDNINGFTTVDKTIPLNDVKVTLTLPAGLADAANAGRSVISKFITVVNPTEMKFIDFPIQIDPTTFGSKQFSVTIEPNPGPTKTVSGVINVASQSRLLIRGSAAGTANLVGSPWKYADTSWSTILSPLAPETDYQVFTYDPQQQTYVRQSSPQRGKGSFIISKVDAGFIPLGGTPSTPPDLGTGAPLLNLKSGWNLIANPYNYAIPLGQLVGVSASDSTHSYTFQELTNQNIISGSFAYWDSTTQSYNFISALNDYIQPNTGYWVYVNTPQDLALSFPAVYETFILPGTGGIRAAGKDWKFNVSASQSGGLTDATTTIGYSASKTGTATFKQAKPPIAPLPQAIGGAVLGTMGNRNLRLAQDITSQTGTQMWDYVVDTKIAGGVRLTFPGIQSLPKNVTVRMMDLSGNRTIDARSTSSYYFNAKERSQYKFRFIVSNIGK